MGEKLKDIKETTSDAVEIIRELGTPQVQQSLDKIRETAKIAQGIIESIKDPQIIKNIENIRLTAEAMDDASMKMENMVLEIKQSGIIDETKEAIKSVRNTVNSVDNNQNLLEMITDIREMLKSISGLLDELKITVAYSKKSGTIHNVKELVHEASSIYSDITVDQKKNNSSSTL